MREQTFKTPAPVAISVRSVAGSVQIEAIEGLGETTVLLRSSKGDSGVEDSAVIEAHEEGGRHRVTVQVPEQRRLGLMNFTPQEVDITVRCPAGSELAAHVVSAYVHAQGELSQAEVRGVSGEVSLDRIAGVASVKTVSGDIEVKDAGGRAYCQTVSGDVELGHAGKASEFRSISGDFRLGRLDGPVAVNTVSGNISLGSVCQGAVTLKAASGDISVGIRRGVRIWVDVRSMSGTTISEMPVSDHEPDGDGPFVELRATAMSGDIRVLRAAG